MSPWFRTTWAVHCSMFRITWVPTANSTTPPQLKTRWHPREYRKRFSSTLNDCLKEGRPFFVSFSFFCLKRVIWVFLSWKEMNLLPRCSSPARRQSRGSTQWTSTREWGVTGFSFCPYSIYIYRFLVFFSSYQFEENGKIWKQLLGVRVPLVDIWSSLLLTAHRFSIL